LVFRHPRPFAIFDLFIRVQESLKVAAAHLFNGTFALNRPHCTYPLSIYDRPFLRQFLLSRGFLEALAKENLEFFWTGATLYER
jgi:hypothetical protein